MLILLQKISHLWLVWKLGITPQSLSFNSLIRAIISCTSRHISSESLLIQKMSHLTNICMLKAPIVMTISTFRIMRWTFIVVMRPCTLIPAATANSRLIRLLFHCLPSLVVSGSIIYINVHTLIWRSSSDHLDSVQYLMNLQCHCSHGDGYQIFFY